ncbi:MAG: serine hydrolase [Lachnospiraceae bacterium]|nr:serine hydrolase [Lachnospiraceae bacterium]
MFELVSPESAGISSEVILDFWKRYDSYEFSTHSIIMARGDKIFAEAYYAPFHKDFKHRMYSVSKSFVAAAVGLCEEEGLLSLDDKLADYFPEYLDAPGGESAEKSGKPGKPAANENLKEMTIRDMLTMSTCIDENIWWFTSGTKDRNEVYFQLNASRIPGTTFRYDSPGSYMLGVIVEKLTGKPFLEYLKEKILHNIGFSEDAYCLKCPGGYSFADSGVMCSARDLLAFARFVMNKGTWDGARYLNQEFLEAATAKQVDNDPRCVGTSYNCHGYGYQIWKAPNDGFAFIGMGDQLAICDPASEFIFIINSDNQGNDNARALLYHEIYHNLVPKLKEPLAENPAAYAELTEYLKSRELVHLSGSRSSFQEKIDGVTYVLEENPMGIEKMRFDFDGDRGTLTYQNAQGEKKLLFGLDRNAFSKFPQDGYSDMIATIEEKGHRYDCACSAAWVEEKKLKLKVQIIDKYFGNICMTFGFKDNRVGIVMVKNAEAFLNEYCGLANGKAQSRNEIGTKGD